MTDQKKKEATKMLMKAQQLFYKKLAEDLTPEERRAINEKVKEELGEVSDLGKEITKAVFNYVCPDTDALVNSTGFLAHANINPDTGETEAIITVECKACGKEHPVMAISFSEMLSMPFIDE
jgi:hypothetical protein